MADLEYIEGLLELCDDRDIAMIKAGGVEIVFNQALGPERESTIPAGDDVSPEIDVYGELMGGSSPKFNNEK